MSETKDEIMFKVDNGVRLDTIFQNVISSFGTDEQIKGYIPMVSFQSIFKGTYNGQSKYQVIMNVNFRKLNDYASVKDYINVTNRANNNFGSEDDKLTFIDSINSKGWFIRKYNYGRSGIDLSVQNVTLNENNSWYFEANKTNEETVIINDDGKENKIELVYASNGSKDEKAKKPIADINELYNVLSIEEKKKYINQCRTIPIKCNTVSKQSTDSNNDQLGLKENITNDLGFMNWKESGFLQELKMDIIGDPMWLYYFTDFNERNKGLTDYPYIIFEYRPYYRYDVDDDPYVNELETFIAPYQVTEIHSTFNSGKFTQNIKAYIPANFYGRNTSQISDSTTDISREQREQIEAKDDIIPQENINNTNGTKQVNKQASSIDLGISNKIGSGHKGSDIAGNASVGSKMNIGMNPLNESSDNLITSYEYSSNDSNKEELKNRYMNINKMQTKYNGQGSGRRDGSIVTVELIGNKKWK